MESNPELRKRLQEILSGDPATQDVILSLIQSERLAAATKVRDAVNGVKLPKISGEYREGHVHAYWECCNAASAMCDEIGKGNN